MKQKAAIERLCKLITKVGTERFLSIVEHDCICGENAITNVDPENAIVDDEIIKFIEDAVENQMEANKTLDKSIKM